MAGHRKLTHDEAMLALGQLQGNLQFYGAHLADFKEALATREAAFASGEDDDPGSPYYLEQMRHLVAYIEASVKTEAEKGHLRVKLNVVPVVKPPKDAPPN